MIIAITRFVSLGSLIRHGADGRLFRGVPFRRLVAPCSQRGFCSCIVWYSHRANIKRLAEGQGKPDINEKWQEGSIDAGKD